MKLTTVLTDIEGTTTSIDFVHKVLFPYASRGLADFLRVHHSEFVETIEAIRARADEPRADLERVIAILLRWIDEDRKVKELKDIQGCLWRQGYLAGAYRGHVYEDAARKLRAWHRKGLTLAVYSSGSVEAQELLFRYSDYGDLRHLFSHHFDTSIGHKRDAESYHTIASVLGVGDGSGLFLSDVVSELDAARQAGFATYQLVRDPKLQTGGHRTARTFDQVRFGGMTEGNQNERTHSLHRK